MPSPETKEDPQISELAVVNCRLRTVLSFLKTGHTSHTLDAAIETAESGLGDMSPAYVMVDNRMMQGTRHMQSLLHMTEAMEIKAEIGHADHALDECTRLLERKVELMRALAAKS